MFRILIQYIYFILFQCISIIFILKIIFCYFILGVQEKLGIMNGGTVFAVFPYKAHENDELSFNAGTRLSVVRKGDDAEREWWWARAPTGQEGYVPRNLLGVNIL